MKARRLVPAILAVFVFIFLYEWGLHGNLLRGIYESTPQLWRPESEMHRTFPFLVAGQFLFTIFLGILFSKGYENRGIGEGIRFGLLTGFLFSSFNLVWYAIQPLPKELPIYWTLGGVLEMVIAGILFALICRPKTI